MSCFLSRLALSSHAFATLLGIKNAVHKRKLSVKASALVLFGPPKCTFSVYCMSEVFGLGLRLRVTV